MASVKKVDLLLLALPLGIAVASAYFIFAASLPESQLPYYYASSPAEDPRASRYSEVIASLSKKAFFAGGLDLSDVIDLSLIEAAKKGYYGKNCNMYGANNTYSKGVISSASPCCVNTLNQTIDEAMPYGTNDEEPEVYRITRFAYDSITESEINNTIVGNLRAKIEAEGGTFISASARVVGSKVSANILNSSERIIREYLVGSWGWGRWGGCGEFGSMPVPCQCTDYSNPACVNFTVSGCSSNYPYSVNVLCFIDAVRGNVVPGAPTNVSTQQKSPYTVEVSWADPLTPVVTIGKYLIYIDGVARSTVNASGVTSYSGRKSFTYDERQETGFTFSDGVTYNFAVRVVSDKSIQGIMSGVSAVTIDKRGPTVNWLNAVRAHANKSNVSLTWHTPGDADLAGYVLYRNGSEIGTFGASASSYADNVPANGTYEYKISAYDDLGNYGPNASATITVDNITELMPVTWNVYDRLMLQYTLSASIQIALNKTTRRIFHYMKVSSLQFDVDVEVNYTYGATAYSESFRKRLEVFPGELPRGGKLVAAKALSHASCLYTYETLGNANIVVTKDRNDPGASYNEWLDVAVKYAEVAESSACSVPIGTYVSSVYSDKGGARLCLVS